ncbi:MAG: hypothetical protein GX351_08115 [Peptococcaceae bacterium]|nr:hypothetical protein [Peptococcaceae bacterium]
MRADGFVLDNGFISYNQLETVLYTFPNVYEAAVSNFRAEDQVLKVYISLENVLSAKEKQDFCEEIEGYIRKTFAISIPISVLIRDKLPITKTGKILRSLLA